MEFLQSGQPAISVDTKKKEQVGDYKNGGREWRPKGQPESVQVHDFGKQKDVPYGVYDLGRNAGWVSVGTDHDTSAFAVESIRRWWNMMGREAYPKARQLLITADSGGSNGARVRLWKLELQKLADETGLEISVCHFPPGTQFFGAASVNGNISSPSFGQVVGAAAPRVVQVAAKFRF